MVKEKLIKKIPVEGAQANIIEVKVSYDIGGWNHFTSTEKERGFHLHVTPIQENGNSRVYTGFTGIRTCVKEMKRFSQKQLDEFEPDSKKVDEMVQYVLRNNQLKIIEDEQ